MAGGDRGPHPPTPPPAGRLGWSAAPRSLGTSPATPTSQSRHDGVGLLVGSCQTTDAPTDGSGRAIWVGGVGPTGLPTGYPGRTRAGGAVFIHHPGLRPSSTTTPTLPSQPRRSAGVAPLGRRSSSSIGPPCPPVWPGRIASTPWTPTAARAGTRSAAAGVQGRPTGYGPPMVYHVPARPPAPAAGDNWLPWAAGRSPPRFRPGRRYLATPL